MHVFVYSYFLLFMLVYNVFTVGFYWITTSSGNVVYRVQPEIMWLRRDTRNEKWRLGRLRFGAVVGAGLSVAFG